MLRTLTVVRTFGALGTFGGSFGFSVSLTFFALSFASTLGRCALFAFLVIAFAWCDVIRAIFLEMVSTALETTVELEDPCCFPVLNARELVASTSIGSESVLELPMHSARNRELSNPTSPPRTSRFPGGRHQTFASDSSCVVGTARSTFVEIGVN